MVLEHIVKGGIIKKKAKGKQNKTQHQFASTKKKNTSDQRDILSQHSS